MTVSTPASAGKKQEVSLTYDSGAPPRLYADPVYSTTGFEVKPDDTKNTLDPSAPITLIFSGVGARAAIPAPSPRRCSTAAAAMTSK